MKKTNVRIGLYQLVWVGLWLTACTAIPVTPQSGAPATAALAVTLVSNSTSALTPTVDATATAAALVIAQALSSASALTSTPLPVVEQTTATVDPVVIQTSDAQRIAMAVAATLTAQPTTTPTATPTWPPTVTPNLDATQTSAAQQIATSVMATLAAQPKATATPTPTWTPVPTLRIQNFATCLEPCRGDNGNAQRTFPVGTKKVYLTWVFSDFRVGAHYTRAWTLVGKGEWTRYECTWAGPEAGIENIALSAPSGLHAGTWEVTITLDQEVVLREQFRIEGDWDLWDPPGLFTTCYGTR